MLVDSSENPRSIGMTDSSHFRERYLKTVQQFGNIHYNTLSALTLLPSILCFLRTKFDKNSQLCKLSLEPMAIIWNYKTKICDENHIWVLCCQTSPLLICLFLCLP